MGMYRLTVTDDRGICLNDESRAARTLRVIERESRIWAESQRVNGHDRASECVVYKIAAESCQETEVLRFLVGAS